VGGLAVDQPGGSGSIPAAGLTWFGGGGEIGARVRRRPMAFLVLPGGTSGQHRAGAFRREVDEANPSLVTTSRRKMADFGTSTAPLYDDVRVALALACADLYAREGEAQLSLSGH